MNLVYTDMSLGCLCALEFLSHKYKDRTNEFIILAKDCGIFNTEKTCEKAVRKLFPDCLFSFQDFWDVGAYKDKITRVYGMSDLTNISRDLKQLPVCKQIYVLMGNDYSEGGWKGDPNAEKDIDAYKYILSRLRGYSLQITLPETKRRFELLRFDGISKSEYFDKYQHELGNYCPELQFLLLVESKQGFMFHLFVDSDFVRKDTTKKILMQDRINRYDSYYTLYKQRCQVYTGICNALDLIRRDHEYINLSSTEKLYMNVAVFFFMYTNGLNKEQRITTAERMLSEWSLQMFTPFVDWLLEHIDDFMYLKKVTSMNELKTVVWKGTHYCSTEMPKYVFDSIAGFKATGVFPIVQGKVMTVDEYREWEDFIYPVSNMPTETQYRELFMLMRVEVNCCNDVKENGRNVFTLDYARERVNELEHNVICAYRDLTGISNASKVFS